MWDPKPLKTHLKGFVKIFPGNILTNPTSRCMIIVEMQGQEVELTEGEKQNTTIDKRVIEVNPEVQSASISTLFLRYSSNWERFLLVLGFACIYWYMMTYIGTIAAGIISPLSYVFYGDMLNALIQKPLNASTVTQVLVIVAILMSLTALLIFGERFFLSTFAGN